MKKTHLWIAYLAVLTVSCGSPAGKESRRTNESENGSGSKGERVITVTIPPFAYFVEALAGDDFKVNVMLPPGADHHIWEPLPAQINALAGSEAIIINGQLGFEQAWLSRFREVNPGMKILDLSRNINLIDAGGAPEEADRHGHEDHMHGGPDPHYWMSPLSALKVAADVKNFLTALNSASGGKYEAGFKMLEAEVMKLDSTLRVVASGPGEKSFLIYHPALGYLARDYGLEQVSFEDEGKSPSPGRMKELIDIARGKGISIIFIQAEYDIRNAQSLAAETGAHLVVINPMNRNWHEAVLEVAKALEATGNRQ